jgi:D-alanyl-D-alanine carboxypeptidase/D-alanyl-D-alanine-endopeptidase (penicillin-binding protein 4)
MLHLIVALLLVAALAPAAAPAAGPAATRAALASQMRFAGGSSGAFAVDLDSGRTIYASRADTARTPASVEKLYTTSTALTLYGAEGHLTTRALGDVGVDLGGVLIGNLYLRGGGDPNFGERQAAELADELVLDNGLREITGRVIGDESAFDSLRGPPSEGYRTTNEVGPLSALTFNRGRTGARRPFWQRSPPLFAARAFTRALKRRDVVIGGAARAGRTAPAALPLAERSSSTMAEIARLTNRPSDNFNAETLIKALGEEFGAGGTTRAGAAVVRRTMTGFGLRPRIADGSGLSRSNRTTPRQVVRLLQHMAGDQAGPAFETSLAVAGRSGTLDNRMRRSVARDRCHAKTGTLNSVSALAGYCESTAGARVAFAFLMNGVNVYGARALQDRMTAALARYSPGS